MPQHSLKQASAKSSNKRIHPRRFSWLLLPTSGVAVVVFSVVLGFNNLLPMQPVMVDVSEQQALIMTADELAWQDVMLMHDELAFIDL